MPSRRFESIGGILNRTATDPIPADEPDDAASTASADSAPAAVTKLRRAGQNPRRPERAATQQPSRKASASSDGGVRRIAFRLDPALHSALTARAASEKTSQGQIVLDGIEAAHQAKVLTDLVAAEAAAPQTGSLFPRLPAGQRKPPSPSRSASTPKPSPSSTSSSPRPAPTPAPSSSSPPSATTSTDRPRLPTDRRGQA